MTRRLLRSFIAGLPAWLDKQVAVPLVVEPAQVAHSLAKKEASSAIPLATNEVTQASTPAGNAVTQTQFLIETISLSPLKQQFDKPSLRLGFLSHDGQQKLGITLTLDEFTAVISALVEKPEGWGLVHPWPKNAASAMTQDSARIFH